MDVLTFETCWAVNSEIIKQVTSVGLSLFNYQDDAQSNKHKSALRLNYIYMVVYFICTTHICTLTLSTLLAERFIGSKRINRMTRSRWMFRICTTTNDLTLYSFSSLYIFMTRGLAHSGRNMLSWRDLVESSEYVPQLMILHCIVFPHYTFLWPEDWPTVAETCRQPNKAKTVLFWHTYPILISVSPTSTTGNYTAQAVSLKN